MRIYKKRQRIPKEEVAYGIFAKKFIVEQKDIEYDGDEYSSI